MSDAEIENKRLMRIVCDLWVALAFYADPESYHAISFLPDRPAGAFADDFSFDEEYNRDMPGKLARNILDYADNGKILLSRCQDGDRPGIAVIAQDSGPGIPNVEFVLQAGYAVSSLGLRGVRVLMDQVEVISEIGKGTTVTARKWQT